MRFSASMLNTWMQCGLQGKFHYVDKLRGPQSASATFGTCVHEALERYNARNHKDFGDVEAAIERFRFTWDNPEVLDVVPKVWNKRVSYGQLMEVGVQCIRNYHEEKSWSDRTVLAVEHRFAVPFGKHVLNGMVDVLEVDEGWLKIEDLKTAGKQPSQDTLRLNIQMTAYEYASRQPEFWMGSGEKDPNSPLYAPGFPNGEEMWEAYKNAPRKVIWMQLRTGKPIDAGARDDLDYMRLYRACEEIEKAIEREVYVPSISGDSCLWCDYTDICPVYIPTQEEVSVWN